PLLDGPLLDGPLLDRPTSCEYRLPTLAPPSVAVNTSCRCGPVAPILKGAEKSIRYTKSKGRAPNERSGLRSKQTLPFSPFVGIALQSLFFAESWEFTPVIGPPGPFAIAVTDVKLSPRFFRSNAPKNAAVAQSPLGVPDISNLSVSESICVNVNVTP